MGIDAVNKKQVKKTKKEMQADITKLVAEVG